LFDKKYQNEILFVITMLWIVPYSWPNLTNGFYSPWYFMSLFSLITLWGLLLHKSFSYQWWIGIIFALFGIFNMGAGFFILIVISIVKMYYMLIDKGNKNLHLPTFIISILFILVAVILYQEVEKHEYLKAYDITSFIIALGKNLAWPWIPVPLASLIIFSPFFIFLFRTLWLRHNPNNAELFVLALGGWVLLQATGMAYARGVDGVGPGPKYMDILIFGIIANLLSLTFLKKVYKFDSLVRFNSLVNIRKIILVSGLIGLLFPIIGQMQHEKELNNEKLEKTREFIRTEDASPLTIYVPEHEQNYLVSVLSKPEVRAFMPHTMTVPKLLKQTIDDNNFVVNGFSPSVPKYQNEQVLGSFNKSGSAATGRFESKFITLKHSMIEIPLAGYLNEDGLSMQLIIEGEKPIDILPEKSAKEKWQSYYLSAPDKPFKIVAVDLRHDSWFAFAMPRSLGKFSYLTLKLLENSWILLALGLLALLFCISFPFFKNRLKPIG